MKEIEVDVVIVGAGLAPGVWSKDVNKALQIFNQLKAGTVWINDWHMLRSDVPFGGYKYSGFGRLF